MYVVVHVLQIGGAGNIPTGEDAEPVLLNVTHGNPSHFSRGYPRNTTLDALMSHIASVTDIPRERMTLTRLVAGR